MFQRVRTYGLVTVPFADVSAGVPVAEAVKVFEVQLPFWALNVKLAVEVAVPDAGTVSVTELPDVGAVKPPVPVPLATVIVREVPRLLRTLPEPSVTLTLAVKVPKFPIAVVVQSK